MKALLPKWTVALLAVFFCGCSRGSASTSADVLMPMDVGAPNDLGSDDEDAFDGGALDSTADVVSDALADWQSDRQDAGSPWGDAMLIDLGGILFPIDPNAVPAPGSECTSDASVRAGEPTIAPPRPIRPLSVSRVGSQRPTFQWVLPEGTTGARIEVCADRCCTRVIQSFDAEGTSARPMTALPPGVVFWRMFGRRAGFVGSRASYTWEFGVRHRDAPNDTSWGTLHDFDGDGFDDLLVLNEIDHARSQTFVYLASGGSTGLGGAAGPIHEILQPYGRGSVGDLNGDGIADAVLSNRERSNPPFLNWLSVLEGRAVSLPEYRRIELGPVGMCAAFAGDSVVEDWNGDGYSDIVVSVNMGCDPFAAVTASILSVYLGSRSGVGPVPQWAERLDESVGFPLVTTSGGVADIDLDGYSDLFVGSHHSGGGTSSEPRRYRVAYGSASGRARFEVLADREITEFALAHPLGDLDGDGRPEFAVVQRYDRAVRVYSPATSLNRPVAILRDLGGGGYFGSWVTHGDINGDGLADLIVSSEQTADISVDGGFRNNGRDYVYLGGSRWMYAWPIWIERGGGGWDHSFGIPVLSPGDVNGDGFDDVIMGGENMTETCASYGRDGISNASPNSCSATTFYGWVDYL